MICREGIRRNNIFLNYISSLMWWPDNYVLQGSFWYIIPLFIHVQFLSVSKKIINFPFVCLAEGALVPANIKEERCRRKTAKPPQIEWLHLAISYVWPFSSSWSLVLSKNSVKYYCTTMPFSMVVSEFAVTLLCNLLGYYQLLNCLLVLW